MNIKPNTVELIGFYGGDETHALSAWTSTTRDTAKLARMGALLDRLARDGHHTPFEKSYLHFLVKSDTATHIQLLKHRIGVSINAESARYKEFKQDSYFAPADWPEELKEKLSKLYEAADQSYHMACEYLTPSLGRKRAKESARFVLPYGHQITSDVGFNFRSFMHFQGLRNSSSAQMEIKQLAQEMLRLVQETHKFDLSLRSFGYGEGEDNQKAESANSKADSASEQSTWEQEAGRGGGSVFGD